MNAGKYEFSIKLNVAETFPWSPCTIINLQTTSVQYQIIQNFLP